MIPVDVNLVKKEIPFNVAREMAFTLAYLVLITENKHIHVPFSMAELKKKLSGLTLEKTKVKNSEGEIIGFDLKLVEQVIKC